MGLTAAVCCLAITSQATVLAPGGFVGVLSQGGAGVPTSAVLTSPYLDGTLSGDILSQVFVSDLNNPYANGTISSVAGALSFYYQINNVGGGAGLSVVSRFTTGGFAGVATDVRYILAGIAAPTFATRDAAPGDGIGFTFATPPVPAPGLSDIMVIHTPYLSFTKSTSSIIDSTFADSGMPVWAPVPEPTTVIAGALLLLPFAASTLRVLRRNRTSV